MNIFERLESIHELSTSLIEDLQPCITRYADKNFKFFEDVLYKFDAFIIIRFLNRLNPSDIETLTDTDFVSYRNNRFLKALGDYIRSSFELGLNPLQHLNQSILSKFIDLLIECCEQTTDILNKKMAYCSSDSEYHILKHTSDNILNFYSVLVHYPTELLE